MRAERYWTSAVAFVLIGAAGLLIGLTALREIATGIIQVLMLMAGAAFFSGLAVFFNLLNQPRTAPLIQFNFNADRLQDELGTLIEAEYDEVYPEKTMPWEPTPDNLVQDDPVLALAKVRIDLERELRRIAIESDLLRSDQRFNIRRILEQLDQKGKFNPTVIRAIQDILPVCNRAVHGQAVDTETAQNVIDIAREILAILRGRRRH